MFPAIYRYESINFCSVIMQECHVMGNLVIAGLIWNLLITSIYGCVLLKYSFVSCKFF